MLKAVNTQQPVIEPIHKFTLFRFGHSPPQRLSFQAFLLVLHYMFSKGVMRESGKLRDAKRHVRLINKIENRNGNPILN